MQTMRIKALIEPLQTLQLLLSFAVEHLKVSRTAPAPLHLHELPKNLRRHVGEGEEQQYVWYAWEHEGEIHLLTGELVLDLGRERGRPVMRISRYLPDGSLDGCGNWIRTEERTWERLRW